MGGFLPIDFINPVFSSSGTAGFLTVIVFNGLIKTDAQFNILPDLAYKWETSKDGLKWKFYLRKGVKFHDNRELTATDVKFTYDLIKNAKQRGYYTPFFEPIEKIKIIDRYTIEIILNQPYAPLLTGLIVGILPKHIYTGKNLMSPEVNQIPIGTGPFKVLSYSSMETVLEANRDYFDNRPYLDRITFRIFKNQKTLFAKMLGGSVDAIHNFSPENVDILQQVTYFKLYKFLKPFYYVLAFRNRGIFDDKRVRIALNYAVNKSRLMKRVLKKEGGKISSVPLFPLSWAYNKKMNDYSYNPPKALELLNMAGWKDSNNNHILDKDGVELDFTAIFKEGDAVDEKTLMQIQVDLSRIKISLKAKGYSMKEYNSRLIQKKFDAIILYIASRGDPDINYRFWHSSQIEKGWNFFSYKNKKIDKYLEEGRRIFDIDLRKKLYYQFQEEMFHDPPGIFLFWANQLFMVHERFKGVKVHSDWFRDLKDWYVPKEKQRS